VNLPIHELASMFPLITETDFDELVEDIKQNGLREKITLYQGSVLDGQNRYRACMAAGVKPEFEEWDGKGTPEAFVISKNLRHRHLSPVEKAKIGARLKTRFEEAARARMTSGVNLSIQGREGEKGKAVDKAAEVIGCSPASIERMTRIEKHGTEELNQAVTEKKIGLQPAAKIAVLPPEEQSEALKKVLTPKAKVESEESLTTPTVNDNSEIDKAKKSLESIMAEISLLTNAVKSEIEAITNKKEADHLTFNLAEFLHKKENEILTSLDFENDLYYRVQKAGQDSYFLMRQIQDVVKKKDTGWILSETIAGLNSIIHMEKDAHFLIEVIKKLQ